MKASSRDTVSTISTNDTTYGECPFTIVKSIGQSKYTVYLVTYVKGQEKLAVKLFPYENDKICASFKREARARTLQHPNIVSIIETQERQKFLQKGKKYYASYVVMELCPHGDFADFLMKTDILRIDERLLRTYFRQLIEGIEYLHSKGISHLDLKPENLLIGEDYLLKICDFDCSYESTDEMITSRGTKNYRAPEIRAQNCEDPQAADIYSAGIILFCLKTGSFPFVEHSKEGILETMLKNEDPAFWKTYLDTHNTTIYFTKEFKSLFKSMVKYDPIERATITEIKNSEWYCGPIYTHSELKAIMSSV